MRCSERRLTVFLIGLGLAAGRPTGLAESVLPEPALRDDAVRIQEQALAAPRPGWLNGQPQAVAEWSARLEVEGLSPGPVTQPALTGLQSALGVVPAAADHTTAHETDLTLTILASRALGEAGLRELFVLAAGRPNVRVVFRGVAPGEPLAAFVREVHARLQALSDVLDRETLPTIEIDPRPFAGPETPLVPTLIVTDGSGAEIARVTGLSHPDWLLRQVAQGRRGDLGVRAPAVAVSEPDLITELERRLAGIDWGARRDAALMRYWERAEFAALPTAAQARERALDLTIAATADIGLPDGSLVVRAGQRVDPLAILPFRQRLFVFDASDPRQVTEVARRGQISRTDGRPPLYLATRLDRAAGWAGYRAVQEALDDPLYLLTPDVQRRFAIERVPALVEARDGVLVVLEWVPED